MTTQECIEYQDKIKKATDGIIKSFEREIESMNALSKELSRLQTEINNLLYMIKYGGDNAN